MIGIEYASWAPMSPLSTLVRNVLPTHPPTQPLAHSSSFEPPRSPLPFCIQYHPPTHPQKQPAAGLCRQGGG